MLAAMRGTLPLSERSRAEINGEHKKSRDPNPNPRFQDHNLKNDRDRRERRKLPQRSRQKRERKRVVQRSRQQRSRSKMRTFYL